MAKARSWVDAAPSPSARRARAGVLRAAAASAGLGISEADELLAQARELADRASRADRHHLTAIVGIRDLACAVRGSSAAAAGVVERMQSEARSRAAEIADAHAEPGSALHRLLCHTLTNPIGSACDAI